MALFSLESPFCNQLSCRCANLAVLADQEKPMNQTFSFEQTLKVTLHLFYTCMFTAFNQDA